MEFNGVNLKLATVWHRFSATSSRNSPLWRALTNAAFVVFWVALCIALVRRWDAMPSSAHYPVVILAVIYPMVWLGLLRNKVSTNILQGVMCTLWGFVALVATYSR